MVTFIPGRGPSGRTRSGAPARPPVRRGAALVEAMVASIILAIAVTGLVTLAGRALASQRLGEDLTIAAALADEQLGLVLAAGPDEYARRYPVRGPCDEPFERFSYDVRLSGGSSAAPYNVSVTIRWRDGGRERSIAVETLLASRTTGEVEPDPDRRPPTPVERSP